MKKILFVSYNHSRCNVADSIQNHRIINALSDYCEIDVIKRSFFKGDNGIWSPNLYFIDRLLYKLFPFLISVFSIDSYIWCKRASHYIKDHLQEYRCAVMIYEPYSTRFLQYKIKNMSGLKLMSILYDPYVDNIFFSNTKIGRWFRKRIEKKIVEKSDVIVVNNEKVYNIFKSRYSGTDIQMIGFCGLPEDCIPNFQKGNSSKKIIVHCGNIFGERHIDEINIVISSLKQRVIDLSNKLQILFLGTYCGNYNKVIDSKNNDVIKHLGPKFGRELFSIIGDSDALLLIDPLDENNCSLPSKLSEYYQFCKPIYGISAKNTPSYISLKKRGFVVCDRSNLNTMVEELYKFINEKGSSPFQKNINEVFRTEFSPATIAEKYYKIVKSF